MYSIKSVVERVGDARHESGQTSFNEYCAPKPQRKNPQRKTITIMKVRANRMKVYFRNSMQPKLQKFNLLNL